MAVQNPYQLSNTDLAEITTWSKGLGLNAENQINDAKQLLVSGQATDMAGLRRLVSAKTGKTPSYSLTPDDESEIRNWATGRGLNPDVQLGSARGLLASGQATDFTSLKDFVAKSDTQSQIGAAKYQLTPDEESEIRAWAVGRGLNPDIQLAEANKLLASGSARSLDDLKSIVQAKDSRDQADQPGTTTTDTITTYDPLKLASDTVKTAPVKTAGVSGYTAATYTPDTYTAEGYEAGGYDAVTRGYETYDAKQGTTQNWDVTPEQTVERRLQGILSKGSPLLTLAETRSKQAMAGKGLLNSSMAQGEALRAVTETATPIATADAATFARAGEFNAEQKNLMERFNVSEINAAEAFNANSANQALSDNQRAENASLEFLANAQNAAKAFTAESNNQAAAFAAEAANVAKAAAAAAENNARAFQAQAENTANIEQARAANAAAAQAIADANRLNELAMAAENDSRKFEAEAKNLSAQNDKLIAADQELAELDRTARNLSETSGQAMTLYNATTERITKLMADPELDPTSKQAAVTQEKQNLQTGLQFLEAVTKVDGLSELLTFNSVQ